MPRKEVQARAVEQQSEAQFTDIPGQVLEDDYEDEEDEEEPGPFVIEDVPTIPVPAFDNEEVQVLLVNLGNPLQEAYHQPVSEVQDSASETCACHLMLSA